MSEQNINIADINRSIENKRIWSTEFYMKKYHVKIFQKCTLMKYIQRQIWICIEADEM